MVLAHIFRQLDPHLEDSKYMETEPADYAEMFRTELAYHVTDGNDNGIASQVQIYDEEIFDII